MLRHYRNRRFYYYYYYYYYYLPHISQTLGQPARQYKNWQFNKVLQVKYGMSENNKELVANLGCLSEYI